MGRLETQSVTRNKKYLKKAILEKLAGKNCIWFLIASLLVMCCAFQNIVGFAQPATPQAVPISPLVVKLEPVGQLKLDTGAPTPWWTYFIPIVGPILSGCLAFFGVWIGVRIGAENTLKITEAGQKNSDAALWQKANETELRDIQIKLDSFYIPFQLLSEANYQFAQDLQLRHKAGYRLLTKLFDIQWRNDLPVGDQKLVEIICNNAEELRAFIANNAGRVDDKILPFLSRATAHFRVLHLAYKGELGNDPTRFQEYVYPRQLDRVMTLEIQRLRNRIEHLKLNPSSPPPAFLQLSIPPELELSKWI